MLSRAVHLVEVTLYVTQTFLGHAPFFGAHHRLFKFWLRITLLGINKCIRMGVLYKRSILHYVKIMYKCLFRNIIIIIIIILKTKDVISHKKEKIICEFFKRIYFPYKNCFLFNFFYNIYISFICPYTHTYLHGEEYIR